MTPVDMTVKHKPEEGTYGDCFRCCIASILDLPAEEVPHFCGYDFDQDPARWYRDLTAWLAPRGLSYFGLEVNPDQFGPQWFSGIEASGFSCFHIMSGETERGTRHSVVGRNGELAHDPHTSRSGLARPGKDGYQFGFIVVRGEKS
jgi:hypothetical protein